MALPRTNGPHTRSCQQFCTAALLLGVFAYGQGVEDFTDDSPVGIDGERRLQSSYETQLNQIASRMLTSLPNLFLMSEGMSGNSINDGGQDMFDEGNRIGVSAGAASAYNLTYTQKCDGTFTDTGAGDVKYYTCKVGRIWIAAFESMSGSIDGVYIDGDLGADGAGTMASGTFFEAGAVQTGTVGYWKQVSGAGTDPSVAQLVMVPSLHWLNSAATDTGNQMHHVTKAGGTGGSSVAQVVYVLFGGAVGKNGYQFPAAELEAAVNIFREDFPNMTYITTTQTTSTVTTVTLTTSSTTATTTTTTVTETTTSTVTTITITTTSTSKTTSTTKTATTTTISTTPTVTTTTSTSSMTTSTTTGTTTSTSMTATTTTITLTTTTSSLTTSTSSLTTSSSSMTSTSTFTSTTVTSSETTSSTTTFSTSTVTTITTSVTTTTASTSTQTTGTATTSTETTSTVTTTTITMTTSTATTSTATTSTVTTTSISTSSTSTATTTSTTTITTSSTTTVTTTTTSATSTTTSTETTSTTTVTTTTTSVSSTSTTSETTTTTTVTTTTTTITSSTTTTVSTTTTTSVTTTSTTTVSTTSTTTTSISSTSTTSKTTTTSTTTITTTSTTKTTSSTSTTTFTSTTTSKTTTTSTVSTSSTTTTTYTTTTTTKTTSWAPDFSWGWNLTYTGVGLRQALPNLYNLPDMGVGTTSVADGALYNQGNRISVTAAGQKSPEIPYSQQCFGTGNYTNVADVSYFTCQASYETFIAGFYSFDSLIEKLEIDGNLFQATLTGSGVAGGERVAALDLGYRSKNGNVTHGGLVGNYRGFAKKTYGGSNPSVNHLILIPEAGGTQWRHELPASTASSEHDAVMGLGRPVKEAIYVVWAGKNGFEYTRAHFEAAMDVVLERMPSTPPYLLTTTTTTSQTKTGTTTTKTTSTTTSVTTTQSTSTRTTVTTTTGTRTTMTISSTSTETKTSTTTTVVAASTEQGASMFQEEVNSFVPDMLKELRDAPAKNQVNRLTADRRAYTVKRVPMGNLNNIDNITLPFDLGEGVMPVSVYVPVSVLKAAGVGQTGDLAVLAAPIHNDILKVMKGGNRGQMVRAGIELTLYWLVSGEKVRDTIFPEPIEFTLPENYTTGMTCEYWDTYLKGWSKSGTFTSPKNKEGEQLQCSTFHLTFFGALYTPCKDFELYSSSATGRLGQPEDWAEKFGSIIWWVILGVVFVMLVVSVFVDFKRKRASNWNWERFLLNRTGAEPTDPKADGSLGDLSKGFCAGFCFPEAMMTLKAIPTAFDNISTNWNEWLFKERKFLDSLCSTLDFCRSQARKERLYGSTFSVMRALTLSNARRLTGVNLGLNQNGVRFVNEDEDLKSYLLQNQSTRELQDVLAHAGTWQKAKTHEEAWARLHYEVSMVLKQQLVLQGDRKHYCEQIWHLFIAYTPFGNAWSSDIFMSSKLRGFLWATKTVGYVFLISLLFQASLRVNGIENEDRPSCHFSESVAEKVFRIFFLALLAALLATIVVCFMRMMHMWHAKLQYFDRPQGYAWKKMLRAWYIQDFMIWFWAVILMSFMLFYVSLYLANLGETDQNDFGAACLVAIILEILVMPAAVAVFRTLTAALLISINCKYYDKERSTLLYEAHPMLTDAGASGPRLGQSSTWPPTRPGQQRPGAASTTTPLNAGITSV